MSSNRNRWIRQTHRWLSMAFTLCVVANFIALGVRRGEQPPGWVTYSPLAPLSLLWFSGVYLFVLPYLARRRAGQRVAAEQVVAEIEKTP